LFRGDLILKEIPYGKRRIKWSYDVVNDRMGFYKKGDILPSRLILNHLINGIKVELMNEKDESICVLGEIK